MSQRRDIKQGSLGSTKVSKSIGMQVGEIRNRLGMTQIQLARRANMQQSAIAQIESGKRNDLRISTIKKLAAALNCKPIVTLNLDEEIKAKLDKMSYELAKKLVAATSGSAAIEQQLPEQSVIDASIVQMQREILQKHRSSLWKTM